MDKYEVNRRVFGNDGFRPGQEQLIDALLAGRDCLGIMPTGGGKSLCYQLPALLLPGLTLVVSPLISLMKDQVAALRSAGVPAACLHSGMEEGAYRELYGGIRRGAYKLVYVAPERLELEGFSQLAGGQALSLLAVDEAHCVSQWGQDFRPSYRRIADFLAGLPRRPAVGAFTATATSEVRDDIIELLGLQNPKVLVTGFDRPNLYFDVLRPRDKMAALLHLIQERPGRCGIVYCSTRARVESVCERLCDAGIAATRYHAGLSDQERRQNQEDFQYDRRSVMVATNAFGMGIDKSNVGYVIHFNMPKSLEAYYQEAGRAGRDGEKADCILLYARGDVTTAEYLIDHSGEEAELPEEIRAQLRLRDRQRLAQMDGYCRTEGCLRAYLLGYFGQAAEAQCGACGNCCAAAAMRDMTVPAQQILSCVKRIRDHLGYWVGPTLVVRVLRGSRDKRLLELGLDGLTTYNLMGGVPQGEVSRYVDRLEQLGYLRRDPSYGTLRLTAAAGDVLYRGKTVGLPERPEEDHLRAPAAAPEAGDSGLLAALKALRLRLARQEGVPAYVIFSNAALADMARRQPETMAQFRAVSGVGQVKAERYGKIFLDAITAYLATVV